MFLHFTHCKCIQNICFNKLGIIVFQELTFLWIIFSEAQNMRQDLWLHLKFPTRKTLGEGLGEVGGTGLVHWGVLPSCDIHDNRNIKQLNILTSF